MQPRQSRSCIMSQSEAKESGKEHTRTQLGMYDLENRSTIQYELVRLPLQNQVSTVRKAAWSVWRDTKALWCKVRTNVIQTGTNVWTKSEDSLRSVGIKHPMIVMESAAVGSAAVLGFLMARKRSLFRRILYPTLGVSLVGGTFYLSLPQNRAEVKDKLKIIYAGFLNSATRGSGAKGRSVGNENSTAADSKER